MFSFNPRQLSYLISAFCVIALIGCGEPKGVARESTADSMQVTKGLEDHQVLQRNEKNEGQFQCNGVCQVSGDLWIRVIRTKDGRPATLQLDWSQPRSVEDGRWKGFANGIPVGGPYRIEFQIRDDPLHQGSMAKGHVLASTSVDDVVVGDIWLLAGQSNMQGCGDMATAETPCPMVRSFESRYRWAIAEEPLHRLTESPNIVHHRLLNSKVRPADIEKIRNAPRKPETKGTGLGIPFAKELYRQTGIPIGLVPCAHGGTNMDQWDPVKLKNHKPGESLYGAMFHRWFSVGGKIKGILWYQGESDAVDQRQPVYLEKMRRFVAAVREQFGDPNLPFYMVQISRVVGLSTVFTEWNAIREDERLLGQEIPGVVTVSAIDLELDDLIHIGTEGHKRLGKRMAKIALHHVYGNDKLQDGPQLKSVSNTCPGEIRVEFDGVNGCLTPLQHIAGFSLHGPKGEDGPDFYDVKVEAPNVVICQFVGNLPPHMNLWYGHGFNPYCNLTDEQDMAAPAFGPIQLNAPTTQKR